MFLEWTFQWWNVSAKECQFQSPFRPFEGTVVWCSMWVLLHEKVVIDSQMFVDRPSTYHCNVCTAESTARSLPPEPPESFGWVSMMVVSILGAANWRARSNKRCVRRTRFPFKRDKNKKKVKQSTRKGPVKLTQTEFKITVHIRWPSICFWPCKNCMTVQLWAVLSQVLNWRHPRNTLLALQESQMPPSFGRSSPHCYADLWKHGRKNKKKQYQ